MLVFWVKAKIFSLYYQTVIRQVMPQVEEPNIKPALGLARSGFFHGFVALRTLRVARVKAWSMRRLGGRSAFVARAIFSGYREFRAARRCLQAFRLWALALLGESGS